MPCRAIFRWAIVLVLFLFSFGKGATAADEPASRPQSGQLVLEARFVDVSDSILATLPEVPQPDLGAAAVLDHRQAIRLITAIPCDLPGGPRVLALLPLSSGQTSKLDIGGNGFVTIQRIVSADPEAIELRLGMFDKKSGASVDPPLQAVVPVGSSWAIHVIHSREAAGYGDTLLEQIGNRLRNRPKMQDSQGFLLLTPRIAGQ